MVLCVWDGYIEYENQRPTEANTDPQKVIDNIISSINEVQNYTISKDIKLIGVGIGRPELLIKRKEN